MPQSLKSRIRKHIDARRNFVAARKKLPATKTKYEALDAAAEKRRRNRHSQRRSRAMKKAAKKGRKLKAMKKAKRSSTTTSMKKVSMKKVPMKKESRNIPVPCCGRRVEDCVCFSQELGKEVSDSFRKTQYRPDSPKF